MLINPSAELFYSALHVLNTRGAIKQHMSVGDRRYYKRKCVVGDVVVFAASSAAVLRWEATSGNEVFIACACADNDVVSITSSVKVAAAAA